MKLKADGSTIAIALAGLAVVIAGSGTAVAVSSTTTVSDPTVPARKAHVDQYGRLTTSGALTTINALAYDYPAVVESALPITSPTKATLAITELVYDNTRNISLANNNVIVTLVKIDVDETGSCAGGVGVPLRRDGLLLGANTGATFPNPIVVTPTPGKHYCLGTIARFAGVTPSSSYPVSVTLGAYVVGGTYTGVGLPGSPAPAPADPVPHTNS